MAVEDTSISLKQQRAPEYVAKLKKSATETFNLIQETYG